jgi:hypothetical protein
MAPRLRGWMPPWRDRGTASRDTPRATDAGDTANVDLSTPRQLLLGQTSDEGVVTNSPLPGTRITVAFSSGTTTSRGELPLWRMQLHRDRDTAARSY